MAEFETVEVKTDLLISAAAWRLAAPQRGCLLGQEEQPQGDAGRQGRRGPLRCGGHGPFRHQPVRGPEGWPEHRQGLRQLREERPHGRSPVDDLVANIARHVDSSVHLFEKWGLPIWKDEKGGVRARGPLAADDQRRVLQGRRRRGREERARRGQYLRAHLHRRSHHGRRPLAGAVGFSVRENKFYVFKAKAVLVAMGGAVHVFKPRSSGEGLGRAWYPPWNSGSSRVLHAEGRRRDDLPGSPLHPVRFKDAYGPVGAWFLLFKSRATNALGEEYMVDAPSRAGELEALRQGEAGSRRTSATTSCMLDVMEGKGPIYMRTEQAIAEDRGVGVQGRPEGLQEEDERARSGGLGRLPRHDDFAGDPVGRHQRRSRKRSPPRSPPPSRTSSVPTPAHPAPGCPVRKTWLRGTNTSGATRTCATVEGPVLQPVTPSGASSTSSPPAPTPRAGSPPRRLSVRGRRTRRSRRSATPWSRS
jgi:hypothetical protein